MKRLILAAVCGMSLAWPEHVAATPPTPTSNLVVNGGFETGNESGFTETGGYTGVESEGGAHTGTYYLSSGPVGGLGYTNQTLNTVAGQQYHFSLFLASDGDTTNQLQINFNGVTLYSQVNLPRQDYMGYSYVVTATGASTLLSIGLRDDPGYLSLDDISVIPVFGSLSGLTPNQSAIGGNLDGFSGVGGLGNIIGNIAIAPTSQIGADLDQLSPQKLQILRNIAFDNFGFTATQLDDHLASLRYGNGGLDTSGLEVLNPTSPAMLSQIESRLLAYSPAPLHEGVISDTADAVLGGVDAKELAPVTAANRISTFIDGNVIIANPGGDSNVPSAHYDTGGVTAGADYRLDDNWAVGAMVGYGHTAATTDANGSKTRVDSYSPGLYATYADHGWYANGLVAYNYNAYNESRAIPVAGATASGSPDGNQFDTNLDGGYEFHHGNLTFGPTLALQYVHLEVNSFTESGAGMADLAVNQQDVDSLRSRLGGEVRYNWSWYGGKVVATPHLSASWQHEYLDNSSGITSQFNGAGLGSFTVNTSRPERDSALIDAGLDTQWSDAFNLFVDYTTQAGQSDFFAQSVEGGVKVSF
jgi:uncharacterized protein YhjY with autotransporter beta-barrel domain